MKLTPLRRRIALQYAILGVVTNVLAQKTPEAEIKEGDPIELSPFVVSSTAEVGYAVSRIAQPRTITLSTKFDF